MGGIGNVRGGWGGDVCVTLVTEGFVMRPEFLHIVIFVFLKVSYIKGCHCGSGDS